MHAQAELALELAPGGRADRLDHLPVRADHDPLLGLGLDPQQRAHRDEAVLLALDDLVDLHLDRVRDLLAGAVQDLLAHELGEPHVLGLVGDLLEREQERALRRERDEVLEQRPDPLAGAGGDREHLGVEAEVRGRLQRGHRADAVEPVDLVDGDDDRHAGAAQRLGDEAVARPADALLAVEQQQDGVGLGELVLDALLHPLGERVARALDARQVGQHELPRIGRVRRVATPRIARRVVCGLSETIATFWPDERVDERRLADVGPPRQRDEAGAGHLTQETISACRASISPLSVS